MCLPVFSSLSVCPSVQCIRLWAGLSVTSHSILWCALTFAIIFHGFGMFLQLEVARKSGKVVAQLRMRQRLSERQLISEQSRNQAVHLAEQKAAAAGRPHLFTRLATAIISGNLQVDSLFVLYLWECGRYHNLKYGSRYGMRWHATTLRFFQHVANQTSGRQALSAMRGMYAAVNFPMPSDSSLAAAAKAADVASGDVEGLSYGSIRHFSKAVLAMGHTHVNLAMDATDIKVTMAGWLGGWMNGGKEGGRGGWMDVWME